MVAETRIIAAAFPNAADAQAAVQELKQRGFSEHDISVLYTDAGHTIRAGLLSGAVWGGVALSGGSFGQGVAVFGDGTARGDFQMILAGTNVLGVATKILVVGWVTAGAANPDGSASISGTCRVDMQDGTVPSTGVPFTAAVTTGGLQLTVGATALPTLVKSAGWIYLE